MLLVWEVIPTYLIVIFFRVRLPSSDSVSVHMWEILLFIKCAKQSIIIYSLPQTQTSPKHGSLFGWLSAWTICWFKPKPSKQNLAPANLTSPVWREPRTDRLTVNCVLFWNLWHWKWYAIWVEGFGLGGTVTQDDQLKPPNLALYISPFWGEPSMGAKSGFGNGTRVGGPVVLFG